MPAVLKPAALKRRLPQLKVRVIRSSDIGVIGVGESTINTIPIIATGFISPTGKLPEIGQQHRSATKVPPFEPGALTRRLIFVEGVG